MQENETQKDLKPMEYTIGAKLEHHRIKKKWTVEQVSKKTYISVNYIIALESGQIDRLPEKVYVLGFIRSYCEVLGISAEPFVNEYKQYDIKEKIVESFYKVYDTKYDNNNRKYIYLSVFIFLLIILWILINPISGLNDNTTNTQVENNEKKEIIIKTETTEISPTTENQDSINDDSLDEYSLDSQDTNKEIAVVETKKKIAVVEKNPNEKIKFIAIKDVAITIYKADGSVYYKDTLKKGRYKSAPLNKGYAIQANDGGLITINIKGLYDYKIMGEDGIVLDKIILNKNALETHFK